MRAVRMEWDQAIHLMRTRLSCPEIPRRGGRMPRQDYLSVNCAKMTQVRCTKEDGLLCLAKTLLVLDRREML